MISDHVIPAEWPDGNSDFAESPLVSGATFSDQSTLLQGCRTVWVFKMLGVRIITIANPYFCLKSNTERSREVFNYCSLMIGWCRVVPPQPAPYSQCFFGNECKIVELFNSFSCLIAQLITDINNQQT